MSGILGYSIDRTSGPSVEPVSLDEMRRYLRVMHDDDDEDITDLIKQARRSVELHSARALITQTWALRLDRWPQDEIAIPAPPLQSVTSVVYVDPNGDDQTWDSGNYDVDTASEPGIIRRAYGISYPEKRSADRSVTITYVAGYGAAGSDVPHEARAAIKILVEHSYRYRGGEQPPPAAYWSLINLLRY